MGGADGAGPTTAAVDQFNFRRTPITSGDGTANHGYWQQKEAEYNALDACSQAKLLLPVQMPPIGALENDWNHLKEISIPGLESTPFKQLIRAYPKQEFTSTFSTIGFQDLFTIRQFYGNPAIGVFKDGPVFDDTRVHGNLFGEFMAQTAPTMTYGHIRDGVVYERVNANEGRQPMMRRVPMLPPAPQQEIAQELLRDFNELRVSGFDARMDVGHFVVPATQQEPQQQVVRRPMANNLQAQQHAPQQWNNRFNHPNSQSGNHFNNHNHQGNHGNHHQQHHPNHNNNHNNCVHARRGGFVNHRGGGRHGNNQRASVSNQAPQNARQAVVNNTPSTSAPSRASPGNENKRGQVIPIQVVVVDKANEAGPLPSDPSGNIFVGEGFRLWTRKRPNNGLEDNTPNKIHFNRNL